MFITLLEKFVFMSFKNLTSFVMELKIDLRYFVDVNIKFLSWFTVLQSQLYSSKFWFSSWRCETWMSVNEIWIGGSLRRSYFTNHRFFGDWCRNFRNSRDICYSSSWCIASRTLQWFFRWLFLQWTRWNCVNNIFKTFVSNERNKQNLKK